MQLLAGGKELQTCKGQAWKNKKVRCGRTFQQPKNRRLNPADISSRRGKFVCLDPWSDRVAPYFGSCLFFQDSLL